MVCKKTIHYLCENGIKKSIPWDQTVIQNFSYESVMKNWFSYFSTKTDVVGTQKDRLNETVHLSTQNMC